MDSRQGHPEPDSESPPVPRSPKLKASSKLNRWSMARALRSGVKIIDRPINAPHRQATTEEADRKTSAIDGDDVAAGKSIYLVSDGTGWTAEHSVNAALGQFEDGLVNRGCSVNTHLFSWVLKVSSF
ncbi:hypothetical protein F2Q68_00033320 [Brassica cretica]|uniref:Uncharacterized protein n=1 Tax=Brassica cretica TaxID=69181 RepID=A0A8S9GBY0_BRACR|nr:hypothetical protein F2Q68_00033320 [Brassica cretica]